MSGTGNSSSPPSGSAVVPVPPPTAAKRKYDQIVSELGPPAERNPKGKRAKRDAMDTKSPLDKLVSMAKFFPRGHQSPETEQHHCDPLHHTDAFEKMVAISPDSIDVLREFHKDDAQWGRLVSRFANSVVTQFRKASEGARQHDTSGLKGKIKYLPSDPTKAIVPALGEPDSKSDRGVNHPIHAKDESEEPTEDATAALKALLNRPKMTDDKPALTHKKFPSCFYADGTHALKTPTLGCSAASSCSECVHVPSPRSITDSASLTERTSHLDSAHLCIGGAETLKQVCHARAAGQFVMAASMLGYMCCQLSQILKGRTMISTSDWKTLDWFTQGVFSGVDTSNFNNEDSDDDDSDSEIAAILARRAARSSATSSDSPNT
ncbi:hypothetical protein B0H19DRAFT_1071633 [Mycena capillaripes]|nr:hypothetical protein B0H19DRAFT_1071633 [Mycena capillaripes]